MAMASSVTGHVAQGCECGFGKHKEKFRPSRLAMVMLLMLFSSLESLPMRYPNCRSVLTPGATGNCLSMFLSSIMLVSILVTFLDATTSLEAMSISPHTHALGGDLWERFSKRPIIQTLSF